MCNSVIVRSVFRLVNKNEELVEIENKAFAEVDLVIKL